MTSRVEGAGGNCYGTTIGGSDGIGNVYEYNPIIWKIPAGNRTTLVNIEHSTMSILGEFKTFISKGNVMDLAVGVIIGGAFQGIVTSLVKDVITPIIAIFGGSHDFSSLKFGPVMIGSFINALVSFLILAAVVFFLIVKPMNALMAKVNKPVPPPDAPAPAEDILLLREIRDSLKKPAAP
jgi:large conductance mechanosensitive channel